MFGIVTYMHKLVNIFSPVLTVLGIAFVTYFDQGNGLESPGIILIPIGVTGVVLSSIVIGNKKYLKSLSITWALATLSVLGLYFGWLSEGLDGLIWLIPATGFILIGFVMLVTQAVRNLLKR